MASFLHTDIQDNGLSRFSALLTAGHTLKLNILKTYTLGDSYATVNTNTIGSVTLTSGMFALSTYSTYFRALTVSPNTNVEIIADSGVADTHVAIVDTTDSKVLSVNDELVNRQLYNGDFVMVPSLVIKLRTA